MKKNRKILRPISEKSALPTNQPTIINNINLIGPPWCHSKKKKKKKKIIKLYKIGKKIKNLLHNELDEKKWKIIKQNNCKKILKPYIKMNKKI